MTSTSPKYVQSISNEKGKVTFSRYGKHGREQCRIEVSAQAGLYADRVIAKNEKVLSFYSHEHKITRHAAQFQFYALYWILNANVGWPKPRAPHPTLDRLVSLRWQAITAGYTLQEFNSDGELIGMRTPDMYD